jgi:16S rRNA (guanine527-N7)-methyltransferase
VGPSPAPGASLSELWRAIEAIAGRPPAPLARNRFAKYLELLTLWNRTHHLTGYRAPRDIVRGLFIDSLLFLPLLPPRPHRLVDIGSGPGIPGIPLRIVEPDIQLTLVESRRKPVSFLAAVKRDLAIDDVEVVLGRAGSEPPDAKGQYDCAVIRALRLDESLLTAALGYLKPGGRLISVARPDGKAPAPSGSSARIEEVSFPSLGCRRSFVVHQR